MKCDECGMVFRRMATDFSQEELFSFMNRVGDASKSPTARLDSNYTEHDRRVVLWRGFLQQLEKLKHSGGNELLDIGSAKGVFMDVARKSGWQVTGVEPSVSDSDYARNTFGVSVFTGTLEEANFPPVSFNLVTMWDVVEHLRNPAETLREVYRVLRPGGLLLVYTPNHNSLIMVLARWLYRVSLHKFPLERLLYPVVHLSFFTPKTLTGLLSKSGFNIEQVSAGPLNPERCYDSTRLIRITTSLLDVMARIFGRSYRILVIASKPMPQENK